MRCAGNRQSDEAGEELKKIGVDANETFFRRVELVLQFLLVFFALWALTVHGLVFLEGSFRSLLFVFPIVLSLALLGLSLFRFAPLSAPGRNRGASDDGDPGGGGALHGGQVSCVLLVEALVRGD